ncbi:hypothetical protein [Kamptonema formosum]|uniref:hypothetical protein n=1 Tax=Kamptonema formosum TaxID=331992 RepID=UPI00034DE87C|nr:hypothetical protein [Oscillatoria sp. PCC 10802]
MLNAHSRPNAECPMPNPQSPIPNPQSKIQYPISKIPSDPFLRGAEYLNAVRRLALHPEAIGVADDINERIRICTWIGHNIDAVNAELEACLDACHSCFYPQDRRVMRILAAPLAGQFGVDALCNILAQPVAILIDAGRIHPQDWLGVVAHEYAHAHLGAPGHDRHFLAAISHLCLGLGLDLPVWDRAWQAGEREAWLRNWPHCRPTPDPLAFWKGGA